MDSEKVKLKNWLNKIVDNKTIFKLVNDVFYNMLETIRNHFKYKFKCNIRQFKMKFIYFLYINNSNKNHIDVKFNRLYEETIQVNSTFLDSLYKQVLDSCINNNIIHRTNAKTKCNFLNLIIYNIDIKTL